MPAVPCARLALPTLLLAVLLVLPTPAPAAAPATPLRTAAPPALRTSMAVRQPDGLASDRLIVRFRPHVTTRARGDLLSVVGARPLAPIDHLDVHVLQVDPARIVTVERTLAGHPHVAQVERDAVVQPAAVEPNDPYWRQQWGPGRAAVPAAWAITTGSPEVTIAVLDTGLTSSVEFAGQLVPGWDVLTGTDDVTDRHGHGTRVASIAAAVTDNATGTAGYCWSCTIMPVKVLEEVGYASDVARGLLWAAEQGADVISISLVTPVDSSVLRQAVDRATELGVVMVAAAGNAGTEDPVYPAAHPGVIAVAATDHDDVLHGWSNRGPWVEVAAPGTHLAINPDGSVLGMSGTSSATPAVAGIVGLALSLEEPVDAAAVRDALHEGAVPVRGIAGGRIDAGAVIRALAGHEAPWLRAVPRRHHGMNAASLRWDGAVGSPASILRDGREVARVEAGTAHLDQVRTRGARQVIYQVCGPAGCTDLTTAAW